MHFTSVVCAIIRRENTFLLARRPEGKRLGGFWEFPGGKIEPGESAEAALHRELAEELGCAVVITHTLPPVEHVYEWGGIRLIPFVCEMAADSAEPFAHEHSALEWAAFEAFQRYELAPADLPVLELLKSIA
jgi:8-oxo-dGTP diphosphatase